MGKSYANFMCKKFFHPASYDNIKRVWMAQQRTDAEKSRQESLRSEYEREQETYVNRQLMGDEKVKHGLTFMYEPPKGFKSEEKDKDGEPEYKFEWQRVAPREGYAKNMDVTDQPFGIAVRKVKCIRCHNWGHVNTDRECPLFNNNKDESISGPSTDKSELLEDMRRDGYVLKQNVLDRKVDHGSKNQQIIPSDEEEVPETAFLKSLSTKDKKKLLKKLNEMEKPNDLRKRKKKKKKIRQHPSSDDNSDYFRGKEPERKKKKSKRQPSSSDDSDSSEDERRQRKENLKRKMKKMQNSKKMQKYSTSADEGSSSEVAENGRVGSGERRRGDRRTNKRRDSEDSVLSKGARPKSGTYRMKYEERGNEHRERKRRERSRGRRQRDSIKECSSDESQREEEGEDQGYKKGRRVAEKKQRDGSRESQSEENDKYRGNGEERSYASKRGRRQGDVSPQDERRDRQSKDLNGRKDQRRDGYIKEKKRDRSRERGERHR